MKHWVGLLFMILGVIGVVLSLLLVPAIWFGRSYAADQIADFAGTVEAPLVRAETSTAELNTAIERMRGRVQSLAGQAEALAQSSAPDQRAAQRLASAIDDALGTDFVRLKESFVALRERLTSARDNLSRLRRLVPGLSPADNALAELGALDRQLTELESSLRDARPSDAVDDVPALSRIVSQAAAALRQVDAALGQLSTRVADLSAVFEQLQVSLADVEARLNYYLTIAAVVLSLLSLYSALLHGALFASGRAWRVAAEQPLSMPTPRLQPTET